MCPDCEKKFSIKKSLLVIGVIAMAIITLDSKASDTHGKMDHSKMNHGKMMKSESKGKLAVTEKVKNEILSSLVVYEELHKSYFEYDSKKVVEKSKQFSELLSKLSERDIVSSLENANVFKFLAAIKAGDNRSVNNSLLDNISKKLNELIISKYDIGSDYNLYHCPMVDKFWIQNSKKMAKVHNPYAPDMPHCGGMK